MNPQNTGLILEPISPEDYILGSDQSLEEKFGAEVLEPSGNWEKYLPEAEHQAPYNFEPSNCVSHGTLSALEILTQRLFNQ